MTHYVLIDAQGYFRDWADVYQVHTDQQGALKAMRRWNRTGKHRVQVIDGELTLYDRVHRRDIGHVYPLVTD